LGWLGIENAARLVLGDTEAGLRAPMFLALPLLAVATHLLARRWLGVGVSFCAAGLLLANGWIVNYTLQLKSYSYEGLVAVATVALYLLVQRTTWRPAQLLGLYAALGLTCVFSLPNLFVVGPLLALDLVRAVRGRHRVALRVAGEALAGAIALAHYVVFVVPQSGVASTGFFRANYAPHGLAAFVRFTYLGLTSYVPSMVAGIEGGAANAAPTYPLPLVVRVLPDHEVTDEPGDAQREREQHHRHRQPLHLVPQRADLFHERDTQEGKHEGQEADPDRL